LPPRQFLSCYQPIFATTWVFEITNGFLVFFEVFNRPPYTAAAPQTLCRRSPKSLPTAPGTPLSRLRIFFAIILNNPELCHCFSLSVSSFISLLLFYPTVSIALLAGFVIHTHLSAARPALVRRFCPTDRLKFVPGCNNFSLGGPEQIAYGGVPSRPCRKPPKTSRTGSVHGFGQGFALHFQGVGVQGVDLASGRRFRPCRTSSSP